MSFTHTVTRTWSDGFANPVSVAESNTSDGQDSRDVTAAANATTVVSIAVDVSALKSLMITTDNAVVLKTNDPDSPNDTITLAANSSLVWTPACGYSNPLTVDVVTIHMVNASMTLAAAVKIRLLQDATP